MRRALVALALSLAACSGGPGVTDASIDAPVAQCGDEVCGPSEYCVSTCLCCGVPGGTPASTEECRPFTRSCDASNMCACSEIASLGGLCDQEHRLVEIPCA
jgi:hypothetical protein